jgi:hypothetical protein
MHILVYIRSGDLRGDVASLEGQQFALKLKEL